MSPHPPFTFFECLPSRSAQALPIELRVRTTQIEEVLLLRLLTGTLDIRSSATGQLTKARTNFSRLDFSLNTRLSAKMILDPFDSEGIKRANVLRYYSSCVTYGNRSLWKRFFLELCNYVCQRNANAHSLAFVHAYRSLELISYCFPLVFAAKSRSYEKTYVDLKRFFSGSDKELSFFIKFVNNHLFGDNLILDQHLPVAINDSEPWLREQYFGLLKKRCDENNGIPLISASPFTEIVITRRGLLKLTIDIRNRYFHLLTGDHNENIGSDELFEADRFFSLINDKVINWLAVIYFEILRSSVESS